MDERISGVKVEALVHYNEGIEPWSPAWNARALFIQPLYLNDDNISEILAPQLDFGWSTQSLL